MNMAPKEEKKDEKEEAQEAQQQAASVFLGPDGSRLVWKAAAVALATGAIDKETVKRLLDQESLMGIEAGYGMRLLGIAAVELGKLRA